VKDLTEGTDKLLAIADAAVAWWSMKRPITMSVDDHLEHPTVNMTTRDEKRLAIVTAEWLKYGKRGGKAQRFRQMLQEKK